MFIILSFKDANITGSSHCHTLQFDNVFMCVLYQNWVDCPFYGKRKECLSLKDSMDDCTHKGEPEKTFEYFFIMR